MADASSADQDLAAGRAALAQGAWADAHARLERAVAAGAGAEALEDLSWAAWWSDQVEACLAAREQAYLGYREHGDERSAARMALWLGDDHLEFRGAQAVAQGWFARAGRLLDHVEACPEHGWLAVFEAHAALERSQLDEVVRLAGHAQLLGRQHDVVDLEMFAVATEGAGRVSRGEVSEGLRYLDEATTVALSGEFEHLAVASWTCCLMLSTCELVRDYDRAGQWCREIEAFSDRTGARFLRGVCRTHYGMIQTWRGNWRDADRELTGALATLGTERPSWRTEALVRLGELRRRQGRREEAEALFEQSGTPGARGLAALRLADGRPVEARDLLERSSRHGHGEGNPERADVLELLVRTLAALGEHDAADVRLGELRSIARAAETDALWAAVHRSEGVLASAMGSAELACEHFDDAVARLGCAGAPVEAAATRIELAETLRDLGRHDAARREARLALVTLTDTDTDAVEERARAMAMIRALDSSGRSDPDRDEVLTSRQVQVLELVARGLSDQQIAEQLVLSPHTVHRHVANIYTRLGCSSRAEAVARAAQLEML